MKNYWIIWLLFLTSIVSVFQATYSAFYSLAYQKWSKSRRKKFHIYSKQKYSLIQRIMLFPFERETLFEKLDVKRRKRVKRLLLFIRTYWIVSILGVSLLIIMIFVPIFKNIYKYYFFAKIILIDIPVNFASFVCTTWDKVHGGVKWYWE